MSRGLTAMSVCQAARSDASAAAAAQMEVAARSQEKLEGHLAVLRATAADCQVLASCSRSYPSPGSYSISYSAGCMTIFCALPERKAEAIALMQTRAEAAEKELAHVKEKAWAIMEEKDAQIRVARVSALPNISLCKPCRGRHCTTACMGLQRE